VGLSTLLSVDEVKNSAKVTLLTFNKTAVFLYGVMVAKYDILEVR